MAFRFWISTSSTAWNVDTNWSTTSGGSANTVFPVSVDDVTFDTNGSVNCILTGDANCTSISLSGNKILDFSTFSLYVDGPISLSATSILKGGDTTPSNSGTVNYVKNGNIVTITKNSHTYLVGQNVTFTSGTLPLSEFRIINETTNTFDIYTTGGNSSGTCVFTIALNGLICTGLYFASTVNSADFTTKTTIQNYGNFSVGDASVWKTLGTGLYIQRGSGNFSSPNSNGCILKTFIIIPNITISLTSTSVIGNNLSTITFSNYGTIALSTFSFTSGGIGGFYFGVNADITGTGSFITYNAQIFPISDWKRTTALTSTGIFQWQGNNISTVRPIAANYGGMSIKFGQGIVSACTNILQQSTGTGNLLTSKKFLGGASTQSQGGSIIDNTNNISILCSEIIALDDTESSTYEAKWKKSGTNLRVASNASTYRTNNTPLSIPLSSDIISVPIDVYSISTGLTSVNKNWTKVNIYDDFITVSDSNTPTLINDPICIFASSILSIFQINELSIVGSQSTNSFTLPISVQCDWNRSGNEMLIHAPKLHSFTLSDGVYITATSDSNALPVGLYAIQGISANQFRLVCANDGNTSGSLTYVSPVTSGIIAYSYIDITMPNSIGSGNSGSCAMEGINKWICGNGTATITSTGLNQNLWTSANYYTLNYTRVGAVATFYFKNITTNTLQVEHNLVNGQQVYINNSQGLRTLPTGMYPVTVVDLYRFSVPCIDIGSLPTTVTGCTRSTTVLTIPSNVHGLSNGDTITITKISDWRVLSLIVSVAVSNVSLNSFTVVCSNFGTSSNITIEWCRTANVYIPVIYPKSTLLTYFKYDKIAFDGSSDDNLIFSDFACISLNTISANTIKSSVSGVQRNIYVNTDSTGQSSPYVGTTFKDISMGSANRINGKTSINLGNNKGIVFKDELYINN